MANRLQKGCEKLRGKIMKMVKRGQKTLKVASLELGINYRQAKRVYQKYLDRGDHALIHGNKGKPSNHRTDHALVQQALTLYREVVGTGRAGNWREYTNAGGDSSQVMDTRTEQLRIPRTAKCEGAFCRTGSIQRQLRTKVRHDWFEGRRGRCCLITLIDDATKIRLSQWS